jgi:hypothetical protein
VAYDGTEGSGTSLETPDDGEALVRVLARAFQDNPRVEGPGLVPHLPHLHELREGGVLPRYLAALPPGGSRQKEVRYLDIREGNLDEARLATWIRKAAARPGWIPEPPA